MITSYKSTERISPHNVRMWIPNLRTSLTFRMYISLMITMGLKRDPSGSCYVGGWPIFLLPNNEKFECGTPTS